ncbi:MAG: hypothetical protein V3V78_02405 [Candidatus Woesearchaeota archaeon]
MDMLIEMIAKSRLDFLKDIEFEEITSGRFFQKDKIDLGNGLKQFYVILGPNVESPIHNHKGENMDEKHLLLYGSGKFIIYEANEKELELEKGVFHPIFSTQTYSPDHKYIAGKEGSICLVLERHYQRE